MQSASTNTYISKRMMSVYKEERDKKQKSSIQQESKPLSQKTFAEEEQKSESSVDPKPLPKQSKEKKEKKKSGGILSFFGIGKSKEESRSSSDE